MELELKHFVGYPKTLGLLLDADVFHTLEGIDYNNGSIISERINFKPGEVTPLLRPLSDIMKEITHQGEIFIPLVKLKNRWDNIKWDTDVKKLCFVLFQDNDDDSINQGIYFTNENWGGPLNEFLSKWVWNQLQEWHFDVHDLLSNNLARTYGYIPKKY